MSELLIELYSEEIPCELFEVIKNEFEKCFKNCFFEAGVIEKLDVAGFFKVYFTPCRIILYINSLSQDFEVKYKKIYGPKIGSTQNEINGFLKAFNLDSVEKLVKEDDSFVFIQENTKIKMKNFLKQNIPLILKKFISVMTETMSWSMNLKWVSPLRNILCILDNEILNFNFCGLNSNNLTYGHKILIGLDKQIKIESFQDYKNKMKENYVIIDQNERKENIIKKLVEIENKCDCSLFECDKEILIDKIINTSEYPNAFLAQFKNTFLRLPEIIFTSIICKKYNYFQLKNNSNNLLSNNFVFFADIKNGANSIKIISNFEMLINNKLNTINLELNSYIAENLDTKLNKLKLLPYYKNFGNIYDKVERIIELSKFICLFLPHCDLLSTVQAAKLCKTDLTTNLVKNNQELKGYLSSYYAEINGYSSNVCEGIQEYYKPQNQNDNIPITDIGKAISLAGKIDIITTLMISDEEYSSSNDPFGIRKNITSIIRIIIEGNINLPLTVLVHKSISLYKTKIYKINNRQKGDVKQKILRTEQNIMELFTKKFINYLAEKKYKENVICSVIECSNKSKKSINLITLYKKIIQINDYIHNNEGSFNEIKTTYKRLSRIVENFKVNEITSLMEKLFQKRNLKNKEEKLISSKIREIKNKMKKADEAKNYDVCFDLLLQLNPVLEKYFKNTLIKTENKKETKSRLFLLLRVKKIFDDFLNFSEFLN